MIPLIYDQLNSNVQDENFFLTLLKQTKGKRVADLGCGTGRLTIRFAEDGYEIVGIDPNGEAIEVAKQKEGAAQIQWIVGDSSDLKENAFDVVIMTANVAQVFTTDESWKQMLRHVFKSLKPGGYFIFDTRNPDAKVWLEWEADTTPDVVTHPYTHERLEIHTSYEGWLGNVFTFHETVRNVRTKEDMIPLPMELCFRTHKEIYHSLTNTGFTRLKTYGDLQLKQAHAHTKSWVFFCQK
ncbi:class I SAM-dependent methyltransferase [Alkalicoccobacillus porphyridii]|uniref:Class I SAM-dependent methyltransferase n=1 Tax=Alkalicoccobacillus porphyridii TaxID=2597270 RepID=A0A553ZYP3_9BACI|nr:class I SAM-dependent methyltransferase [Alkalicoccobacillus porphyridii]TSB46525.1 class I SAM-dependent methyltransferase [Alkalicoccobacillus porphyridii]